MGLFSRLRALTAAQSPATTEDGAMSEGMATPEPTPEVVGTEAEGDAELAQLDAERGGLNPNEWQEAIRRYDAEGEADRQAALNTHDEDLLDREYPDFDQESRLHILEEQWVAEAGYDVDPETFERDAELDTHDTSTHGAEADQDGAFWRSPDYQEAMQMHPISDETAAQVIKGTDEAEEIDHPTAIAQTSQALPFTGGELMSPALAEEYARGNQARWDSYRASYDADPAGFERTAELDTHDEDQDQYDRYIAGLETAHFTDLETRQRAGVLAGDAWPGASGDFDEAEQAVRRFAAEHPGARTDNLQAWDNSHAAVMDDSWADDEDQHDAYAESLTTAVADEERPADAWAAADYAAVPDGRRRWVDTTPEVEHRVETERLVERE